MTRTTGHALEIKLNASADDIMDAVLKGFRAQVDVKGKLAELFLHREFEQLEQRGEIAGHEWFDVDGKPDFEVALRSGRKLVVECKNLRSDPRFAPERGCRVELQKTRGGKDAKGRQTRGYAVDHFDVLAACTFNQTREWRYRFIPVGRLLRRPGSRDLLQVMQPVTLGTPGKGWQDRFLDAVADLG